MDKAALYQPSQCFYKDQDAVKEILHEAWGIGDCKLYLKRRDMSVLRKYFAFLEKITSGESQTTK